MYSMNNVGAARNSTSTRRGQDTNLKMMDNEGDSKNDKDKHDGTNSEMKLLCFDISRLSRSLQFVFCMGGVFFFYMIYGYFQELIFRLEGFKPFGWYLTLVQFFLYSIFGLIENRSQERKIPFKTYVLLAVVTVGTMGLSNSSLGYLNYPTQVIFKCCKLIPVLIGGIIIQKKKYGTIDLLACICMSIGLIYFTLADSTVSPSFNPYGVFLISLALCADAIIGNVQEKAMKQYKGSNSEMVLYSYAIGFVYILIGQIVSGQIGPAFSFCSKYPLETYGYALIFSITGYFGVNIVLTLVKSFGVLTAVTVTTCRKALTIIFSFLFFTKPFTIQYVWSGLIVIFGIYLNLYSKNQERWNASLYAYTDKLFRRKKTISMQKLDNII